MTTQEILEEGVSLKRYYERARNAESSWTMKEEAFWRDRYYAFLDENNLTDKDIKNFMYPEKENASI